MEHLQQFFLPYIIAQLAALVFVLTARKNTHYARWLFVLLFAWASATNFYLGFTNPDVYLDYAPLAIPLYRNFILGWFSQYNYILVPLIAAGQAAIAVGMALQGRRVMIACIGAIIFLLSIAPLLVGSGFPFSLLVSWAAWRILKYDEKDYIWKKAGSVQKTAGYYNDC